MFRKMYNSFIAYREPGKACMRPALELEYLAAIDKIYSLISIITEINEQNNQTTVFMVKPYTHENRKSHHL